MKRIGERLQADTQRIMDELGVPIQASQYPFLAAARQAGAAHDRGAGGRGRDHPARRHARLGSACRAGPAQGAAGAGRPAPQNRLSVEKGPAAGQCFKAKRVAADRERGRVISAASFPGRCSSSWQRSRTASPPRRSIAVRQAPERCADETYARPACLERPRDAACGPGGRRGARQALSAVDRAVRRREGRQPGKPAGA